MTRSLPRAVILRWALGGIAFGLLFPLCGTLVAGGGLVHAHRTQPVLYVVDLAPVVLGVDGAVIGRNDIFEPYRTFGAGETDGGIGLGLTVSRALVREMGGDLTYHHFGGWAIFRVRLPMAPESLRSASSTKVFS